MALSFYTLKEYTMTDQSNVFGTNQDSNTQETPETVQPQGGDIFSNQLKEIKAEDGRQKYDTVEKALGALAHSQTLIPTLQQQIAALELEKTQLREELAKSKGVQEIVDSLTNHQQQGQEGNPSETHFGEADVAKLVEATLSKREQEQLKSSNEKRVQAALVATYGTKAFDVVKAKAQELNTTPEALGLLASQSPEMVLALFNTKSTSPSVTTSSFNIDPTPREDAPLGRPTKGLLSGASAKEQKEFMAQVKAEVYKKLNITE